MWTKVASHSYVLSIFEEFKLVSASKRFTGGGDDCIKFGLFGEWIKEITELIDKF